VYLEALLRAIFLVTVAVAGTIAKVLGVWIVLWLVVLLGLAAPFLSARARTWPPLAALLRGHDSIAARKMRPSPGIGIRRTNGKRLDPGFVPIQNVATDSVWFGLTGVITGPRMDRDPSTARLRLLRDTKIHGVLRGEAPQR